MFSDCRSDVKASWLVFSVYRSSDSGISSGSTEIVGKMRETPSEIHPWAVRLKVGLLAVGSCSSGYLAGFRSISGTLKLIPRGAFSNPPYGVASLRTKHSAFKHFHYSSMDFPWYFISLHSLHHCQLQAYLIIWL